MEKLGGGRGMIDIQKTFTLYQVANWLNNEKYESPNIIIAYVIGRCFVNIILYMILYLLKIQVCKLGVIIYDYIPIFNVRDSINIQWKRTFWEKDGAVIEEVNCH